MTTCILAALIAPEALFQRRTTPAVRVQPVARVRKLSTTGVLMRDPLAVEAVLKNPGRGRGSRVSMLLPSYLHSAAQGAARKRGFLRAVETPRNLAAAKLASSKFGGLSYLDTPIEVKDSLPMPTTDVYEGSERALFHGVCLKGGTVKVKPLSGSGIVCYGVWRKRSETGPNGETLYDQKNFSNGQGESLPLAAGQGYSVVFEMDAKTPGSKSTVFLIDDGTKITLTASGQVNAIKPSLSASISGGPFDMTAGQPIQASLSVKSNLLGKTVSIQPPTIEGISIDCPKSVTIPNTGSVKVPVTFSPSATMVDLPSTSAPFVLTASDGTKTTAAPVVSVSTYWIETDQYLQESGDVVLWGKWRINSSGYCVYTVDIHTEAFFFGDDARFGFTLVPAIDNMGSKYGFTGGISMDGGAWINFHTLIYEGVDARLVSYFNKITSFNIGLFVNSPKDFDDWKAKQKIVFLNLKSVG